MTRKSRTLPIILSIFLALALLALGRTALGAPDADVDLRINKSSSANSVTAGTLLTYTLVVTNTGPAAATGVAITDTLPAGVSFASASSGCVFDTNSAEVRCSVGALDVGATASPTIYVQVAPSALGQLVNQAAAGSTDTETNTIDNQDSVTTAVTTSADLVLITLESSDPVIAGDVLTYTLTISNAGPSDAAGVTLVNDFQPGITFLTSSLPCSRQGTTLTCDLGGIAANSQTQVVLAFSIDPGRTQDLDNSATVSSATDDPNNANNSAADNTAVTAAADLSVTKTATASLVAPGEVFTYNITVTNNGLSNAGSVTVSDPLPAEVLFQSYTSTQGGCSGTATITCTPGLLAPGEAVTIALEVMVDPQAASGEFTNTVSVSSSTADPLAGNNTASATATVQLDASADLQLTKTDSADPVTAGEVLTYTLGVANLGPDAATGVVMTDTLPAGLALVSATPSQGSCTGAVCALGTISASQQATVTLVVDVDAGLSGVSTNAAIVTAVEVDPVLVNNNASEQTTHTPLADLGLDKSASPQPVYAGGLLEYQLTVTNQGPSAAGEVQVVDALPPEVSFVSASPGCVHTSGSVDCSLGTLGPGAADSVTVTVQVGLSVTGTITNTAAVSSNAVDLVLTNNQDQAASTVLLDLTSPTVSWASPVSDTLTAYVGCQVVHLEVNAADDVAVQWVRFYRWDPVVLQFVDIGYDYAAPYEWEFDACSLPLAWNQLFARARDASGKQSERKDIWLYRSNLQYLPVILQE